uniref:Uncharacterized protein n=1 Tax=Anguilla anguilla TaxID=7936 RepID=A0A0E9W4L4_ANGAN
MAQTLSASECDFNLFLSAWRSSI